jgi:uncharacterized membrane-anchored protein
MKGAKKRLQSKTVQAVVLAAVVSVANAYMAVSGEQINVEQIKFWSDIGLQLVAEGLTLGLLWRAYKGRVTATEVIDTNKSPLPWKREE